MKIEIEITRQDFMDFNRCHFRTKSLVRTSAIGLVGLLILQYSINKDKENVSISTVMISSILYILIFAALIYFILSRSKSIPKDNGSFLGKKVYDFSEEFFSYSDKDSEGRFQYQAVKSMEEDGKSFYLYLDTMMAILIPKRYFSDKTEEKIFRDFVRSKLKGV
ncbi:MAG: hypothetical protein BGO54_06285 [Sphingobacteriales bacterium 46-32]|nr:MAG: hypothetical protein BGO54_06285 [Sphingobacteriales bacterium 46-32]